MGEPNEQNGKDRWRWWSDMTEDELRADLAGLLGVAPETLVDVGVLGKRGPAVALYDPDRNENRVRYTFYGDGRVTSWEAESAA